MTKRRDQRKPAPDPITGDSETSRFDPADAEADRIGPGDLEIEFVFEVDELPLSRERGPRWLG